ncbi:FHA domain-containing protein [Massilia forsythiae]|uniref:FHA domain-containing protein n=1 Tax=Massilia forsythiae TaxID=2728020 RepID=A0A7Z2W0H6_9BURK|nr:FHA domain-containing protein [Massilia forsythiae]QJE02676.1 FHA domain-containing protein [Massilia forsythiae]
MKRCASPDHPHCTTWVMPGAPVCAHGHAQPADPGHEAAMTADAAAPALLPRALPQAVPALPVYAQPVPARPHLRVSGFDPRAAGGRQTIKLTLHAMAADAPARLEARLASELLAGSGARLAFTRDVHGGWLPLYIEFSSRGREHGQYRIDVELRGEPPRRHEAPAAADAGAPVAARAWVATLVLLVPRPDASLEEIHRTFLSTHKNVRISADDASIARVHGLDAGGPMDIEIAARNAGIARLDLAGLAGNGHGGGKIDLALPTIAWDEDLIEIDLAAASRAGAQVPARLAGAHPCPASSACLVAANGRAGVPRHLRLFALDECVLGRWESTQAGAGPALLHYGAHGPEADGLTRRLSARHALVRPRRDGFEIEDVSRYGLLLDGAWPGKRHAVPLRAGMRIEFTASIRGVVLLEVGALSAHGVLLRRADGGADDECFLLLAPERHPDAALTAAAMPPLFHRDGGFWHLDRASGRETALAPGGAAGSLAGLEGYGRFAATARPEDRRPG